MCGINGIIKKNKCSMAREELSSLVSVMNKKINEDHTIMIVFNGEIYNFSKLRSEDHFKGYFFWSYSGGAF